MSAAAVGPPHDGKLPSLLEVASQLTEKLLATASRSSGATSP